MKGHSFAGACYCGYTWWFRLKLLEGPSHFVGLKEEICNMFNGARAHIPLETAGDCECCTLLWLYLVISVEAVAGSIAFCGPKGGSMQHV